MSFSIKLEGQCDTSVKGKYVFVPSLIFVLI